MGRPMTEAIVAAAKITPGLRVLDVTSGTGEPAISIATVLNGTGHVTATDISSEPLSIGEARARERGLTNIEFRVADVHALPFSDRSFERVTSRLGVMFFANVDQALREICRVLAKDGQATLLAWGPMEQGYFSSTIGTVLRCLPSLRAPDSGRNMFKFGEPGTLTHALQNAGFEHAKEVQSEVAWNWPGTPEDLWSYFQDVTAPFKPLFQSVPQASRGDVDQAVLAELHRRFDGEFVRFNARIVLASAIK